jgi:hypothetical protein
MAVNYGGFSGIGGRCLGRRIGDVASVGGEVERARRRRIYMDRRWR